MYMRPVDGENADGFQSLRPDAVGQISCTTVPTFVSLSGFMMGRPGLGSMPRKEWTWAHGPAGIEIENKNGVEMAVRHGGEGLAVLAVDHIELTVAIRMQQHLAWIAVHGHVDQDLLVDPVIVVLVMRVKLQPPSGGAGVGIARKQRRRPFVVARTLFLIPRARIAGPVIDQVQVGIVSDPSPH